MHFSINDQILWSLLQAITIYHSRVFTFIWLLPQEKADETWETYLKSYAPPLPLTSPSTLPFMYSSYISYVSFSL